MYWGFKMIKTIYITVDENNVISNGWSDIRTSDQEIEVQIDESDSFFSESPKLFIYQDGKIIKSDNLALKKAKYLKGQELNQACNNAILSGFDYNINGVSYHFSFDTEAQLNFQGANWMLENGKTTNIMWTVKNNSTGVYERMTINLDLMRDLQVAIFNHKNDNISKYRDVLYPKLLAATTVEEINEITWDSEPI